MLPARQFTFGGTPEEKLRAAIAARDLMQIRGALVGAAGVDAALVAEAKGLVTELATESLREAIKRRDLVQLRMAIQTNEAEAAVVAEARGVVATDELKQAIEGARGGGAGATVAGCGLRVAQTATTLP